MTTAPSPTETYILPTTAWSCLLGPIARDAKPGACLVTCTAAMYITLTQAGRDDMTVELRKEV